MAVERSQEDPAGPSLLETFFLLLMALGPIALSVWAGLKAWRGAEAHLRLNQTMSIAFAIFAVVALLAYIFSRVYLLVEIILVIP